MASELRKRPLGPGSGPDADGSDAAPARRQPKHRAAPAWVTASAVVLVLAAAGLAGHAVFTLSHITPATKIFTPAELSGYGAGRPAFKYGGRLLLAVLGKVFDVTAGHQHYNQPGGYGGFSGRDASKSFVTGDFENDLHDDIAHFTPEEFEAVLGWREFYESHEKYRYMGRLTGRFYDAQGRPTPLLERIEAEVAAHRAEKAAKEAAEGFKSDEVLCNVKWTKAEGGFVWCYEDWFPRRVAVPAAQADGSGVAEKCVCFPDDEVSEARRGYEGCAPDAQRCQTSPPEE